MAGYSSTPLARKLGITPGDTVALVDGPDHLGEILAPLPDDVVIRHDLRAAVDVAVVFFTSRAAFRRRLGPLTRAIFPAGGAWVAWPKRASGVPTDMTEDVVRAEALPLGVVDNKVCAIDDTWSGLRLVWRRENR
ncbi:MAG: DUF3052 domain-containing protein [Acidimicrobiales bacterium]